MSKASTSERLPRLLPADLLPDQAELYESIAHGPRSRGPQLFRLVDSEGALEGPFRAMLLSPPFGAALQELGSVVRYRGGLPDRPREIAILVVGNSWRSDFEIYAHEAVGRAVGITDLELDLIAKDRLHELPDPYERQVACTTQALCSRSDLSDPEFAQARETLGERVLFELITLVGYYATLALQLRAYRIRRPDEG